MKRLSKIVPPPLLFLLLIYNSFFVAYSLQRHYTFKTGGFDLGNYEQMVWGALHGWPMWFTQHVGMTSGLGNHAELTILLLVPLYGLFPAPETLLVVQVGVVSLGALPVYWFARQRLRTSSAGLIFAAVYLLFPALQSALLFDFHSITLATPFITFALWAMYTSHTRLFVVMAILTALSKEDLPLLTAMMGLYIWLIQGRRRLGLLTFVASLAWFLLLLYAIIPAFSAAGGSRYFYRYAAWGNSLPEMAWNLLTRPLAALQYATEGDKLLYWLRLTMPVAFIALLSPVTLLLAAPLLLAYTLSNYPPYYQLDLFFYSAPLAAYVTFAAIIGLQRLLDAAAPRFQQLTPIFLQRTFLGLILFATLAYQIQFGHTPLGQRYFDWPARTPRHAQIEALLAQIPPDARVAAENNLASRLSNRTWVFVPPIFEPQTRPVDYLVLDLRGNLDLYESRQTYCNQLAQFLADPAYGLIYAEEGLLLFQRRSADIATFEPMFPCQDISP